MCKTQIVLRRTGNESGGHGGAAALSTFTLVSEILAALPTDGTAPPVVAAGGLATGAQVASYLTLGAAGAVLGTRFILTPESPYPPAAKAALLSARSTSTVRTLALDYARGTYGWPAGIDGRGIRNKIVDEIEAGVEHSAVQARFAEAAKTNDPDYMVVWSGQGVSLMNEIVPAKVRPTQDRVFSSSALIKFASHLLGYHGGATHGHCAAPSAVAGADPRLEPHLLSLLLKWANSSCTEGKFCHRSQ